MKVHYISFFVDADEAPERVMVISPQSKIRYIADCIKEKGFELVLVSTAFPLDGRSSLEEKVVRVDDLESHCYLPMRPVSRMIGASARMRKAISEYVAACVKPEDVVVVYHSPSYIPLYRQLGKAEFRFVLEINDRYCLHYANPFKAKLVDYCEKKSLMFADGYILASLWMVEVIPEGSPSIVNYGDCSICPPGKNRVKRCSCRIVYAGVVEGLRRAAYIVAESAMFLPRGYEVHIAGFGSASDIAGLEELVARVNDGCDHGKAVFHGMLAGSDLDEFLMAGDVAVNAHSYERGDQWKARYSFPSKIPFYLGHGLNVITTCEQEFAISPFHRCLRYFQGGSPESLARTIVDFKGEDSARIDPRAVAAEVDAAFRKELELMINGEHRVQEVPNEQA